VGDAKSEINVIEKPQQRASLNVGDSQCDTRRFINGNGL